MTTSRQIRAIHFALYLGLLCFSVSFAQAPVENVPSSDESQAEAVDVEKIKTKYWAQGEESKLGVVQNRVYSKANKFQIGLLFSESISDPFLSIGNYGGSVGYNFNEYLGINAMAWQYKVKASNALNTLRDGGKQANTVEPKLFYGVEGTGSFLYGKLSLLGSAIVYYDMHVSLGSGFTKTENDPKSFTPTVGLGQRFYIGKLLALRMDYRVLSYQETVKEKEIITKIGEIQGTRRNYTHNLSLQIDFMFGGQ